MCVDLEISCAFEYFRGSRGYGGEDLIQYFPVQNSKDYSTPAAQMATAG